MKIAVTSTEEKTDALTDKRFGRASCFFFIESDGEPGYFRPNTQNRQAEQGAGIQAAQTVLKEDAEILLTGHCGPKAWRVLNAAGIKVYTIQDEKTVEEALQLFTENKLPLLDSADVEGHW